MKTQNYVRKKHASREVFKDISFIKKKVEHQKIKGSTENVTSMYDINELHFRTFHFGISIVLLLLR